MEKKEYTAVASLALIMSVRMLGLFMILPVFSAHMGEFAGANAQLMGLALGIYGLTQALLQMPFGMWSDRIGRKPMIAIGLFIFIIGSVYAALAHNIYELIIGRALQGGGAVGSTLLAMVADLTRDEHRSKAMGIMGLAVGGSFAIAMMAGPLLDAWVGLAGIFWVTAALAALGALLLWLAVPKPPVLVHHDADEAKPANLSKVLKNNQLLRLDASIFTLHAILTALFIAVPIILTQELHLNPTTQMVLYVLVLVLAFALMLPFMILAEKKRQTKPIFLGAIAVLLLTQVLLWLFHQQVWALCAILLAFFTAFSLLEATLPAWISKVTPIQNKGTAMGVYSTSQFLGIFVGGSVGGWVFGHFGIDGIFVLGSVMALIWLVLALPLPQPPYRATLTFGLPQFDPSLPHELLAKHLREIVGVVEVAVMPAEAMLYLKIDSAIISKSRLREHLENSKLLTTHPPKEDTAWGSNEVGY